MVVRNTVLATGPLALARQVSSTVFWKEIIEHVWATARVTLMVEDDNSRHYDELLVDHTAMRHRSGLKDSLHMMISHHPPSLYGHCLRISVGGRSLYLCGRCSGIYAGLLGGLGILFFFSPVLEPSWFWFLFALAIGFTTVVDWITQRLTPRKTTVYIRAGTGFLSGLSLAIIFYLANVFYMLIALAVTGVTITGVSVIENRNRQHRLRRATSREQGV